MANKERMLRLLVEDNVISQELVDYVEEMGQEAPYTLYRGSWHFLSELVPGNIIEVRNGVLSSWSKDKEQAIMFAGSLYDDCFLEDVIEHDDLVEEKQTRVVYICNGIKKAVDIQELLIEEDYSDDFVNEAEWIVSDLRYKVISVQNKRYSVMDDTAEGNEIIGYDYKEVVVEPVNTRPCRNQIKEKLATPVSYFTWYAELEFHLKREKEVTTTIINGIDNANIRGLEVCEIYQGSKHVYVRGNEELYLNYLMMN